MTVTTMTDWTRARPQPGWLARLFDYKPFLVFMCLLPALGLLLVFLTYPLGLAIWLSFTDTKIGGAGKFVGLDNFEYLMEDPQFWSAVFYSVFYTGVATFGKFALGLWLALLLNNHVPFKSLLRAIILLPWIVPTVLSALAFWWLYDPQFSIFSYLAVGRAAEQLVGSQTMDHPLAPIETLGKLGGQVLLLGVTHTSNTTIHLAEQQLGRAQGSEDTWDTARSEYHVELKPDLEKPTRLAPTQGQEQETVNVQSELPNQLQSERLFPAHLFPVCGLLASIWRRP